MSSDIPCQFINFWKWFLNLVFLSTRSLQHCAKLCAHQWVFHSEVTAIRFRRILRIAKLHRPESIHHWAFWWNIRSPALSGPMLDGNVFTAAPVSRFIFTRSNRFGLQVAPRSKPPSENEFAEVSYVCSPTSFHPTKLQSSFHSSELQPSIILHPISSSQDLKDQLSMFCPCVRLWHLGWHSWFLWIFLVLFTLTFALTLGPWLALCLCQTRIPAQARVARLWITKSQTKLRLHVRHSRRASSNVQKRFELRIRCFSSSSGTNDSRRANLILSSNLSFIFFSQRDTQDPHRSIPAWSSKRERRPREMEMIVRRRFRFLLGSNRFCSLRHAFNGFFRELAAS